MAKKAKRKLRVMMKENPKGQWSVWVEGCRVVKNESAMLAVGVVIGIFTAIENPMLRGEHSGE